MKKEYFIKIENRDNFEIATDLLKKLNFFTETDLHLIDCETMKTSSKTLQNQVIYYLVYKNIKTVIFETPTGVAFKRSCEFNLHLN